MNSNILSRTKLPRSAVKLSDIHRVRDSPQRTMDRVLASLLKYNPASCDEGLGDYFKKLGKTDSIHHHLLEVTSETANVQELKQKLLYTTTSGWWWCWCIESVFRSFDLINTCKTIGAAVSEDALDKGHRPRNVSSRTSSIRERPIKRLAN